MTSFAVARGDSQAIVRHLALADGLGMDTSRGVETEPTEFLKQIMRIFQGIIQSPDTARFINVGR